MQKIAERNTQMRLLNYVHASNVNEALALLETGVDINFTDTDGYTPLHHATLRGCAEMVELLLNYGPEVNALSLRQYSALSIAVSNDYIDIAETLLNHNASVNILDDEGRNPYQVAIYSGCDEEMCLLLIKHGVEIKPNNDLSGNSALHEAVDLQFKSVAKRLLDDGVNIEAHDKNNLTPIHLSAINAKMDMFNLLLEHGANISATSNVEDTLLHNAAMGGCVRIVNQLMQLGADMNAKNDDNQTPMHYAAAAGNIEAMNIFIEHGFDIQMKDSSGNNPLDALVVAKISGRHAMGYLLQHYQDASLYASADKARKDGNVKAADYIKTYTDNRVLMAAVVSTSELNAQAQAPSRRRRI